MKIKYVAMLIFSKNDEPALGYFWGMGCLHCEYFIHRSNNDPKIVVENHSLKSIRTACSDSLTLNMLEGKELDQYLMARDLVK